MNQNKYMFIDIDDVLVTTRQHFSKNLHPKYMSNPFDTKCVKIFNNIINIINPIIIVSSDWKLHYNMDVLNEIFQDNGIIGNITDVTPNLWGSQFNNLSQLEECRAAEILKFVNDNNVIEYVAIDDLNLFHWIPNNFVHCTRSNEGLKQCGIYEKIINKLK